MTWEEALTWLDSHAESETDDEAVEALQAELARRGGPCSTCRHQYHPGPMRVFCHRTKSPCAESGGGCWAWESVASSVVKGVV